MEGKLRFGYSICIWYFCYFMHEYPIKSVMVFGVDFRQGRALTEDIQYLNTRCTHIIFSHYFSYRKILYFFFRWWLNIKSVKNSKWIHNITVHCCSIVELLLKKKNIASKYLYLQSFGILQEYPQYHVLHYAAVLFIRLFV